MYRTGLISLLSAAAVALLPMNLSAQGAFEGVITGTTMIDGETGEVIVRVKGSKSRLEFDADGERAVIIRDGDGRVLSLLEETRQYFVSSVPPGEDDDAAQFAPTGRSETIAGYPCEYYRMDDPSGIQDGDEVCVTTALGFVGFGAAGSLAPGDEGAIREQFPNGFLILKTLDSTGAVDYVVTEIERTALDDSLFEPPSGYTEFKMPGGGAPPAQ
jgi:hypothetical protein